MRKVLRRSILKISIILFAALIFSASFNYLFTLDWETEDERLLKVAERYFDSSECAELEDIGRFYDSSWQEELWRARWKTSDGNLFEIQLEPTTQELRFFLDSTVVEKNNQQGSEIKARERAWSTAFEFLESQNLYGRETVNEEELIRNCIKKDKRGWALVYNHIYNGIRVHGDFIRVVIEPNGYNVREFSKHWHSIQKNTYDYIHENEAIQVIKNLEINYAQEDTAVELEYVPIAGSYHLAWVVNTVQFEYWVDAVTSDILRFDSILGAYDGNVFAWDDDPNGHLTYVTAESIYHRLDTAVDFPSSGQAYYRENQTLNSYVNLLDDSDVYFIIGHGGLGYDGNDYVSYICATDDNMYPSDVATKTISSMELAFLCSCSSFSDDEDVDQTIAQEFLDGGADCVFGWTGNVLKGPAQTYCKDFFDMAVNDQKNFDYCYDYADGKTDQDTRDISKIAKSVPYWSWLYLNEDDAGDSFTNADNLGLGGERWIYVYDEGIWVASPSSKSWDDEDWFKFGITEQYDIEIWATPQDLCGLDIKMKIYNSAQQLIATCDAGDANDEEHYPSTTWGSGTYYIYIESVGPGHGGWFDLIIHVSTS